MSLFSSFKSELLLLTLGATAVLATAPLFLKKDKLFDFEKQPLNAITANQAVSKPIRAFKNTMLEQKHTLSHLPIEKFQPPSSLSSSASATTQAHAKPPCVIIACGSFSPPTYFHLRMMEDAKRRLSHDFEVIGGVLSPVHDQYGVLHKESLKQANRYHRVHMCRAAIANSDWIGISDWEVKQNGWTKTANVLQSYSDALNSDEYLQFLSNNNCNISADGNTGQKKKRKTLKQHLLFAKTQTDAASESECTPENHKIHIKFLCGSDLLRSFLEPGLWQEADRQSILSEYGVVCLQRRDNQITEEFLNANDVFRNNIENIHLCEPCVENQISSSIVRTLIKDNHNRNREQEQQSAVGNSRGSVQYLLPDSVIQYIQENNLYL